VARTYTAQDGTEYPLTEARYDVAFKVYRSDRSKAISGDPYRCLLALGIKRNRNVKEAYIGSGKDAYVVFGDDDGDDEAVHFLIGTTVRKVLDSFDTDKKAATMQIMLTRPSKSMKIATRRADGKKHRDKAKAAKKANGGNPPPKKRALTTRPMRLGLAHRPRPNISRGGDVDVSAPVEP